VLHPGCRFPVKGDCPQKRSDRPPLIIWNHRWAFDKNPHEFFRALEVLSQRGLQFRLALLGENTQAVPKPFLRAKTRLGRHIVCCGFEPSQKKYLQWLRRGHIVISTACQENFGIAVVEAIRYGCIPLLPNRLAYPEIVPSNLQADLLYDSDTQLVQKLGNLITNYHAYDQIRSQLCQAMGKYAWEACIGRYDDLLERLAAL
jgi:glycosyltransferase involved in cell wall biosynthesis